MIKNKKKNKNNVTIGLMTTVVWAVIIELFLHYGLGKLLHGVGILLHGVGGITTITLPFEVGIVIFVVSILLFLGGAMLLWKLLFKIGKKVECNHIKKRS